MTPFDAMIDRVRRGERLDAIAADLDLEYQDLLATLRLLERLTGETLPRAPRGRPPNMKRRAAMAKARAQGMTLKEIAARHGITIPAVCYQLRKHREGAEGVVSC